MTVQGIEKIFCEEHVLTQIEGGFWGLFLGGAISVLMVEVLP